jgi:heme exporter protein C
MRRWVSIAFEFATLAFMVGALYAIFLYAPIEKTMGIIQKIFYFHVSAAFLSFFAFFIVFVASILYLHRRDRKWDILAQSSAEIGVIFCTLVLITGPIWAKPIWNVWWTWDPRLTTTLILWFIYVSGSEGKLCRCVRDCRVHQRAHHFFRHQDMEDDPSGCYQIQRD